MFCWCFWIKEIIMIHVNSFPYLPEINIRPYLNSDTHLREFPLTSISTYLNPVPHLPEIDIRPYLNSDTHLHEFSPTSIRVPALTWHQQPPLPQFRYRLIWISTYDNPVPHLPELNNRPYLNYFTWICGQELRRFPHYTNPVLCSHVFGPELCRSEN